MKKLLGIVVLGLLLSSNAKAVPKWIDSKILEVCKVKQDIISIDWQMGYFESGATMGFNYKKKNEGKFIERLAKEHKIK